MGEMTEARIEQRLRMHILNLCLATAGKRENDIRDAEGSLIREVVRIVHDATNPHLTTSQKAGDKT